ncbi:MAG: AI-2E family transporter, partial [Nitrospira sp.]|nr:AI-2E family transporter [Nitrospira sp.]
VTVLILFFIFRDGKGFLNIIRSSGIVPVREVDLFIKETGDVIIAVLYGVVLTAMIQGALGGFGFWVLGLPAPVLFGTLMFILALVPFAGTPVVWLPAAIWLIYNGSIGKGIFLLVWGVLAISTIDNFLRPYFISKKLGFHGLLSFIGIIGGMIAFGFIGVFLGPLLIAIPLRLFEIYLKAEE